MKSIVRLVAEFAGGVDVRAIPAADVVLIVEERVAFGAAIEDIPQESAVWRSLRAAPLMLLLEDWVPRPRQETRHFPGTLR
jgi:hypothetical protein